MVRVELQQRVSLIPQCLPPCLVPEPRRAFGGDAQAPPRRRGGGDGDPARLIAPEDSPAGGADAVHAAHRGVCELRISDSILDIGVSQGTAERKVVGGRPLDAAGKKWYDICLGGLLKDPPVSSRRSYETDHTEVNTMGQLKNWAIADGGFTDYLESLIDSEMIDDPTALGITKQVVDKGIRSLTEKQWFVFEKKVLEPLTVEECDRCGESIPWSEMLEALDSGLCGYCDHMREKMMGE